MPYRRSAGSRVVRNPLPIEFAGETIGTTCIEKGQTITMADGGIDLK